MLMDWKRTPRSQGESDLCFKLLISNDFGVAGIPPRKRRRHMSSLLTEAALAVQARTQTSIQAVIMKQQVKADQGVVELLAQAVQAQPAPGTGLVVDKQA